MGYFVSRAAEIAWDVLSGVANVCGMFSTGCQKNGMKCFVLGYFVTLSGSRIPIFYSHSPNSDQ